MIPMRFSQCEPIRDSRSVSDLMAAGDTAGKGGTTIGIVVTAGIGGAADVAGAG